MAWWYFFVHRCDHPPPHWQPTYVKGAEFRSEAAAKRYVDDLVHYSGQTQTPLTVNTWRHYGRPGDRWVDLGWSAQSCP